jgi:antitoxin ParD1/3/4
MPFRISLNPESEAVVRKLLDSGRYSSASEVVREALTLLEDHDQLREIRRADLMRKLQEGIAALDRGEGRDADEVFAEVIARCEARTARDAAE